MPSDHPLLLWMLLLMLMESVSFSPGAGWTMYHNTTPSLLFKMMMMMTMRMMMMMIIAMMMTMMMIVMLMILNVHCRSTKNSRVGKSPFWKLVDSNYSWWKYEHGGQCPPCWYTLVESGQFSCAEVKGRMNPHPRRFCEEQCNATEGELEGNIFTLPCHAILYLETRSKGALRDPTFSWRCFRPCDFIFGALRPCDPCR